jgi:hypothetical protein
MYAYIKNNKVVEYPVLVYSWRQQNPLISLPAEPTQSQLNAVGIYKVEQLLQPVVDYTKVVEPGQIELVGSTWTQTWQVREASSQEKAVNIAKIFVEYRQQMQQDLTAFAQTNSSFVAIKTEIEAAIAQAQSNAVSGTAPLPGSYEQLRAQLPELVWP